MASDLKECGNKRNELRDQVALYEGNKQKVEPPTRKKIIRNMRQEE
jgi:hypothetical protein